MEFLGLGCVAFAVLVLGGCVWAVRNPDRLDRLRRWFREN